MRKIYLDYAKGFAIILMLFAHVISGDNLIKTWIFSFHMPIFFIISGILLSDKWMTITPCGEDCIEFFKKRLFSLGIPYLFWGIILTAFYSFLEYFSGNQMNYKEYLFGLFSLQGIDSLWFIPCFFVAQLLALFSLRKRLFKGIAVGGCLIIFIIILFFSSYFLKLWSLRLLLKMMVCFSFTYMGYWIGNIKLCDRIPVWISMCGLMIGAVLSQVNGFVGVGSLEFGNGLLFYINAIITSVSVIGLFNNLEVKYDLKILNFYGENTMILLCTNNLFIEIIRLLDYKLTGDFLLSHGLSGAVLFTIILLMLGIPIIGISNTSCGVVFGKKRRVAK
jgi:fucose 4-O-acetylase-like acetyltransferase